MRFTGRKGWQASFNDTWSLDSTLAPIIVAGLKKFKEVITEDGKDYRKGYPVDILTEVSEKHGLPYGEETNYCVSEELGELTWNTFLGYIDEMIYAFESEEPEFDRPIHLKDLKRGEIHKEKEWQDYVQERKEWNERCLKGRMLFAKHFESLWW